MEKSGHFYQIKKPPGDSRRLSSLRFVVFDCRNSKDSTKECADISGSFGDLFRIGKKRRIINGTQTDIKRRKRRDKQTN